MNSNHHDQSIGINRPVFQPGMGSFSSVIYKIVDTVLGISELDVLNGGQVHPHVENPAEVLMRTANIMRSEAFDPKTGRLDYIKLAESDAYSSFRDFARSLPHCTIEEIGDQVHQVAFWINIYNAIILDAIIHYEVRGSLLRDPGFFRRAAYIIGDFRFSADDIEHGILRGNRRHPYLPFPPFDASDPRREMRIKDLDPRIHFALVCGAKSCPPIAFYDGDRLDQQLELAASSFINGGGVQYDHTNHTLQLSRIFRWYQGDFGGLDEVRRFILERSEDPNVIQVLEAGIGRIKYQNYNWSVNSLS